MFIEAHPRLSTFALPKSLPLNLFADPHPLNLYATILYKKGGGRGVSGTGIPTLPHSSLSSLDATLMNLFASVANKRLTAKLNPLDATLTKNGGGYLLQARGLSLSVLPRRSDLQTFRRANVPTFQRVSSIPFLIRYLRTSPTQRAAPNPLLINHLRTVLIATEGVPLPHFSMVHRSGDFLPSAESKPVGDRDGTVWGFARLERTGEKGEGRGAAAAWAVANAEVAGASLRECAAF